MTQTQPSERGGRDPLSVVLVAAIVTLGVMYALDWRREQAFEAHAQAVEQLAGLGPLADPECVATPVGLEGQAAMLACQGRPAEQLRAELLEHGWPEGAPAQFTQWALRGPQGTLICDRQLRQCAPHPLPDRAFYEEANRRRRRER